MCFTRFEVFYVLVPCSVVVGYYFNPEVGGSTVFQNFGIHTTQHNNPENEV
jgi:hypothetical protein